MKNSILVAVMLSSAIVGGIFGGGINDIQRDREIAEAWDSVMIVDNGTLVANPAYYALHPEELARDKRVIIANVRGEAIARVEMTTGLNDPFEAPQNTLLRN